MTDASISIKNHAAFIWSVADLLRGDYKQSEYGKVILPLTVLRRFDCVLEPVKAQMLETYARIEGKVENFGPVLDQLTDISGLWNTSKFDIPKLLDDDRNIADNLRAYIHGFAPEAREILERFDFATQIARLQKAGLLYLVLGKFAEVDLHPDRVSNLEMGYLYEELIRKFSELSNETAGEHFTPREVIRLMVNLLFVEDDDLLTKPGVKATLYDPACGTGGMLSVAEDFVRAHNPKAELNVFGQELNDETFAICRSDMMLKGQDATNIAVGNSLKAFSPDDPGDKGDQHHGARFDYLLANPPFGVEWKKVADSVQKEHDTLGFAGRYGAGLPRINDGSFLFLQHMISKMKPPEQGGSRLAIVFNGSPLFTGAAGSGESEIRRWIIENDWLEAVVALPDQLFYNTGISTYFWIVTNRKRPARRGKVQLIDARQLFTKMRKSLGEKRKEISDAQIAEIVRLHGNFDQQQSEADAARVKVFPNEAFGFLRITLERPLRLRWEITTDGIETLRADKKVAKLTDTERDTIIATLAEHTGASGRSEVTKLAGAAVRAVGVAGKAVETAIVDAFAVRDDQAPVITGKGGKPEPDGELRDNENVPLPPDRVRYEPNPAGRLATTTYVKAVEQYIVDEVHPYVPDAWIDHTKTKIGYEIPLTRLLSDATREAGMLPLRRVATVCDLVERADAATKRTPYLPPDLLHTARSTVDLGEFVDADNPPRAVSRCTGGDVVGNGRNWRCLEASFGDAVTSLHVIRPASGVSGVALAEWLGSKSLAYATASTAPLGLSRSILERFPVPERQVRDAELADALTEIVQARRVLGALASNVIENAFDEGDPSRASLRVRSLETSVKQVLSLAEPLSPDLSWRGVTMT